jgi:hypothetical protein
VRLRHARYARRRAALGLLLTAGPGRAQPPYRGEVLAALFLAAYAGLVIPVLAVGIALIWLPSSIELLALSVLELVLVSWSGRRTLSALRS